MLKFGSMLPKLANDCLHKCTCSKAYRLTETDKGLQKKVGKDMVSGLSVVFTGKAFVDDTFFATAQPFPNPVSWLRLPNFAIFFPLSIKLTRFAKPKQKRDKNKVISRKNQTRPSNRKFVSLYTIPTQTKNVCFTADGFLIHYNRVFGATWCFHQYCSYNEEQLSRRFRTRNWIKGNGCNTKKLHQRQSLQKCGDFGLWVVDTVQKICCSEASIQWIVSFNKAFKRWINIETMKKRKSVAVFVHWQCDMQNSQQLRKQFSLFVYSLRVLLYAGGILVS